MKRTLGALLLLGSIACGASPTTPTKLESLGRLPADPTSPPHNFLNNHGPMPGPYNGRPWQEPKHPPIPRGMMVCFTQPRGYCRTDGQVCWLEIDWYFDESCPAEPIS